MATEAAKSIAANPFPGLPEEIYQAMCSAIFTEFATMTAKGVPIDTPTYGFISPDGRSIGLTTGLAYPAKAERARRNPKVGLLLEGTSDAPVISIAARASVHDADIQSNVERYIAETAAYLEVQSYGLPWSQIREAVWYWARMIVECTPVRIMWWPNAAAMDGPPNVWRAPADAVYPASDPAPASAPSAPPSWGVRDWRELAQERLDMGLAGHLTVVDEEGFPLPIRARSATLVDGGFSLDIPAGAPWRAEGPATLCFMGMATFIGEARQSGDTTSFIVERALPVLPTVEDPKEVFQPTEATRETFMKRLEEELARRGQPMPVAPLDFPEPTAGSHLRAAQMKRVADEMAMRN